MKKIVTFILLSMMIYLGTPNVKADSNYKAFEDITINTGKLLEDFSDADYNTYYKEVNKRKFSGWRTYTVNQNIEATYITDTKFSYYNDGYTAIKYHYKLEQETTSKLSLSATGTISIKTTSTKAVFKNNLEGSLKLSADYQVSSTEKETCEIDFEVDPGTQVDLYIYGEGKITNGVAARYFFWGRMQKGGYELFVVTTQYQRLEKTKI